jgi:hypothetical protein
MAPLMERRARRGGWSGREGRRTSKAAGGLNEVIQVIYYSLAGGCDLDLLVGEKASGGW